MAKTPPAVGVPKSPLPQCAPTLTDEMLAHKLQSPVTRKCRPIFAQSFAVMGVLLDILDSIRCGGKKMGRRTPLMGLIEVWAQQGKLGVPRYDLDHCFAASTVNIPCASCHGVAACDSRRPSTSETYGRASGWGALPAGRTAASGAPPRALATPLKP